MSLVARFLSAPAETACPRWPCGSERAAPSDAAAWRWVSVGAGFEPRVRAAGRPLRHRIATANNTTPGRLAVDLSARPAGAGGGQIRAARRCHTAAALCRAR